LLVLLQAHSFLAYLKSMNINYKMLHPTSRKTLRAEVELTFIEYAPTSV